MAVDILRSLGSIGCAPGMIDDVMGMPGRLLATYPLLPSFKYCQKLDCYVDSLEHVDKNVPAPHPPPKKKADIFNLDDFEEVDFRALNTPARYLKSSLKELVDYLIEGLLTDLSKIRVIYRWITCQPIDQMMFRREPQQNHVEFQLWRIKNKKGNYAQLVSLLCRHANLPCVIVHGMLKGSTYEVGDSIDEDRHYGEWNAVLINKHWRFLNAYWGTCAEGASTQNGSATDRNGMLYYSCDENYFLTDPDQNAATHFPKSPKWQLKESPLTLEEFEEMTFVKDRYFNLRMKTVSHPKCLINTDTGEVEIKFFVPRQSSIDIDFQYLLFKLEDDEEKRIDRYVFMHRTNNQENLTIKIRYPTYGTLRFELVGKDCSIMDENYDYDWIAIYKIFVGHGLKGCQPYPSMPAIGWGPARAARQAGIVPLSHFTGEIMMDDAGKVEIRFGAVDKYRIGEMIYGGMVYTGGEKMEELSDLVIHRVEDGDVIFNVMTPDKGEYVLKLFLRTDVDSQVGREFCSYLLLSKQKEQNGKYPKDFRERLGPRFPAFAGSGLKPSKPSGYLKTDQSDFSLSFTRNNSIQMSVNLSSEKLKPNEASMLISQEEKGDKVTYKLRLPETGLYGVKLRGTTEEGAIHEPLYEYIIDYKKQKKRTKNDISIRKEAESFDEKDPEETSSEQMSTEATSNGTKSNGKDGAQGDDDEDLDEGVSKLPKDITDKEINALLNKRKGKGVSFFDKLLGNSDTDTTLSESSWSISGLLIEADDEESGGEEAKASEETPEEKVWDETSIEVLRRRMRMSIEEWNMDELRTVLKDLKSCNLASVKPDVQVAEMHLDLMKLKKDLLVAIRDKDFNKLKSAIRRVNKAGHADRLEYEMAVAKHLMSRLKKLQKLLHAVLALDQSTIAEIRSYATPPPIVQTVMMATLLLLGYWHEETKKWKAIQTLLGKTGRDSIKRLISEFKIETCPLEVACGARDSLKEYSIEQVRLVSAGCATFYVWVVGVVEELEKRAGDEVFDNIRPKTSRGKKNRQRELTFLKDLEGENTSQ